jgi:DNA-binding MarR family transcriptional regulator
LLLGVRFVPQRGNHALSDGDYRLLAAFRHALRRFLRFSEAAAAEQGLTPQQHQALLAIRGAGSAGRLGVGGLAEQLQIRPHSAVGLASRLEALGLVRREAGTDDARHVLLALTPAAERLLERLSRTHRDELRLVSPALRELLALLGEDPGAP